MACADWNELKDLISVREVKELKTVARTDDYSDDSESEEEGEEGGVGTALQLTRAELGGRHVTPEAKRADHNVVEAARADRLQAEEDGQIEEGRRVRR